jgi:hypothetical protein
MRGSEAMNDMIGLTVTAALFASVSFSATPDRLEQHMTILGVTLEKTTLQEAQRILGPAEVRHNGGDAGASASGECYVGADGATLALVSNSEMGGGTTITNAQLVARGSQPDYSSDDRYVVPPEHRPPCAALKSLSRATRTQGGLRLGMTEGEVRRLLGKPSESGEGYLLFTSEAKLPMTPEQRKRIEENYHSKWDDYFIRGRAVRVEFDGGKATAIRASQITSS